MGGRNPSSPLLSVHLSLWIISLCDGDLGSADGWMSGCFSILLFLSNFSFLYLYQSKQNPLFNMEKSTGIYDRRTKEDFTFSTKKIRCLGLALIFSNFQCPIQSCSSNLGGMGEKNDTQLVITMRRSEIPLSCQGKGDTSGRSRKFCLHFP